MVRRRRDECFSCLSPGYMASHLYFVKQWIWFCLEVAEVEPMRKWTGSKAVMTSRTACSSRSSSHALAGSSPGDTGHKAGLMPGVNMAVSHVPVSHMAVSHVCGRSHATVPMWWYLGRQIPPHRDELVGWNEVIYPGPSQVATCSRAPRDAPESCAHAPHHAVPQ